MTGDRIISALIGLVGAVSNNGKTEQTDVVVREALLHRMIRQWKSHWYRKSTS